MLQVIYSAEKSTNLQILIIYFDICSRETLAILKTDPVQV